VAGFRGTLNYGLAAKKKPELIGGNMAGETARELAYEFGLGRALNRQVGKPVFHASLTAAPADQLCEDDWRRFAALYRERLGYGECQQALIRHHDTERDHVNVVANRIDRHGRRVDHFMERKRGEAIVRDLEREFGLTEVAPSSASLRTAPGRGELAAFARTGQVAGKARLQGYIDPTGSAKQGRSHGQDRSWETKKHRSARRLFTDLGERRLQKFVCEKEAVLPERLDKRPGGLAPCPALGPLSKTAGLPQRALAAGAWSRRHSK
jgi:hypothetical protein